MTTGVGIMQNLAKQAVIARPQAVAISWYNASTQKQKQMSSAPQKGYPMHYYVYILTNRNNTVLYTGVTNNLIRRIYEHKNNADPQSFTARYNIHKLIYFEETGDVDSAIEREKQIKSWSRDKKIALVYESNPKFYDLYPNLLG